MYFSHLGLTRARTILTALAVLALILSALSSAAARSVDDDFINTWSVTDRPVAEMQVSRTWMWGDGAYSDVISEPYAGSPGGWRQVQYFDKSRMEITNPHADPNQLWYVTNGLLAKELLSGNLQLGDALFEPRSPADIPVAGDSDDVLGPTYATFTPLVAQAPGNIGALVDQTIDRAGNQGRNEALAGHGVTLAQHVPETDHTVASVFWSFMNSTGTVYIDGAYRYSALFENVFYVTGYPLTEPVWAQVKVAGEVKWVLIQVFERRVLTFTPGNPTGWEVEFGNVGQHYFGWRYNQVVSPTPTQPEQSGSSSETPDNGSNMNGDTGNANPPSGNEGSDQSGGGPTTPSDNEGPNSGHGQAPPDDSNNSGDGSGSQTKECTQKNQNSSNSGSNSQSNNQSNNAEINQSGPGTNKAVCSQSNKSTQRLP